jgi:hypothetical protein
MVTLVPVLKSVPVTVPLRLPAPVAALNVIVVSLLGLAGFPLPSCDSTVTLKLVPAVPVVGTVVYTSLVAAPAENTIFPLVTDPKVVIPADAVALSVIVSAFE